MTKYRPSNGTEGEQFQNTFCHECEHDDINNFREQGEKSCDILLRSLCFDIEAPEYPLEWIYQDGLPTCTAFVEHVPSELELSKLEVIRKERRRVRLKNLPRRILRYRPKWYQNKRERARLNIAQRIHAKRPETCWAEWVSWAFGHCSIKDALDSGAGCKADAKKDGACYCGQFNSTNMEAHT